MPEGPEHFKSAEFINKCCRGRTFSGKVVKSEVNVKNPSVEFEVEKYEIHAKSRGKELMVTLQEVVEDEKKPKECIVKQENDRGPGKDIQTLSIVFQFGMSGCFRFTNEKNLHKHSHLMFHTLDDMILSFVDVRRFGRWRISDTFSPDRGPDLVNEYGAFRKNVLEHLDNKIFEKPICEVLHNQKFFNGVGNYLRAEILFRANVRPFEKAIDVLNGLDMNKAEPNRKSKNNEEAADILEWCTLIPFEVMMLEGGGYDQTDETSEYNVFEEWLRCYYNKAFKNLVDHDGRTIWFQGDPGPLAPRGKSAKSRHTIRADLAKVKVKQQSKGKDKIEKKKNDNVKSTNSRKDDSLKVKNRKRKLINEPIKQSTPRKQKPQPQPVTGRRRSARLNK